MASTFDEVKRISKIIKCLLIFKILNLIFNYLISTQTFSNFIYLL